MRTSDFKWSKTRVQCPYCQGWFTRQGILGHIRFRHQDKTSKKEPEAQSLDYMYRSQAYSLFVKAAKMMGEYGRLSPEVRDVLWDLMLIDYISKIATKEL